MSLIPPFFGTIVFPLLFRQFHFTSYKSYGAKKKLGADMCRVPFPQSEELLPWKCDMCDFFFPNHTEARIVFARVPGPPEPVSHLLAPYFSPQVA